MKRSLHRIIECDKKLSFSSFHTMMCVWLCRLLTLVRASQRKTKIISQHDCDDGDDDDHDDEENNRRSNKTKMNILLCVHTFKPNRRERKHTHTRTHSLVSQNEKKTRKEEMKREKKRKWTAWDKINEIVEEEFKMIHTHTCWHHEEEKTKRRQNKNTRNTRKI